MHAKPTKAQSCRFWSRLLYNENVCSIFSASVGIPTWLRYHCHTSRCINPQPCRVKPI